MLNKGKQKTKLTQVMHTLKKKKKRERKITKSLGRTFPFNKPLIRR